MLNALKAKVALQEKSTANEYTTLLSDYTHLTHQLADLQQKQSQFHTSDLTLYTSIYEMNANIATELIEKLATADRVLQLNGDWGLEIEEHHDKEEERKGFERKFGKWDDLEQYIKDGCEVLLNEGQFLVLIVSSCILIICSREPAD